MPAKSEAQRRLLYAKFGSAWVHKHHYANKGHLPEHVGKKKGKTMKKHSVPGVTVDGKPHEAEHHIEVHRGDQEAMGIKQHAKKGPSKGKNISKAAKNDQSGTGMGEDCE